MSSSSSRPESDEQQAVVVTTAVRRAATKLGLTNAQLAAVLGVSPSTISRADAAPLSRPKSIELALLLIRVYRSLSGIVQNDETAKRWMSIENEYLGGRPAELVQTTEGLVTTLQYLDAMRARI